MRPPAPRTARTGGGSPLRGLALVAALLLSATASAAQQSDFARVRAAFPGAAGDRIVSLIEEGRRDGLPVSLLVNKALEGAQKNASPDRVARTLADYSGELREARAAVGREVGEEALKEAADALRRGVPASTIRSLARSSRGDLSILFVALFDLMEQGVPPGPAEALIEDALRSGLEGDRLLSLPASVNQLIRSGLAPAEAADSVRRQIGGGVSLLPAAPWERGGAAWPSRSRGGAPSGWPIPAGRGPGPP